MPSSAGDPVPVQEDRREDHTAHLTAVTRSEVALRGAAERTADPATRRAALAGRRNGAPVAVSLREVEIGDGVGLAVLLVEVHAPAGGPPQDLELLGAFPVLATGATRPWRVARIREWEDEVEARILGYPAGPGGGALQETIFFATDYAERKEQYTAGAVSTVCLSAFALETLRVTAATDEGSEHLLARWLAGEYQPPPDEYQLHGRVRGVRAVQVLGEPGLILSVDADYLRGLDLYVARRLLVASGGITLAGGAHPAPGDWVFGRVWLQGRAVGGSGGGAGPRNLDLGAD